MALAAPPVRGQELPEPGMRVRVHAQPRETQPVLGAIAAWRPDTLVVLSDAGHGEVPIAFGRIVRLERSTGMGSGMAGGAETGAILGTVAGMAIFAGARHIDTNFKIGIGASLGLAAGALVGAVIGAGRRVERWERAPVPRPETIGTHAREIGRGEPAASFRARVDAPTRFGEPRTGLLVTRTADSLLFQPDGRHQRPEWLANSEVRSLEVSTGRRHHAWTGGAAFGLAGAGLGGLWGAGLAGAGGAVVGGLALGGVGLIAGAFVGGLEETDVWEPVPITRNP